MFMGNYHNNNKLPYTRKYVHSFIRTIFLKTTAREFDNLSRMNITSPVINYANFTIRLFIIGVRNHLNMNGCDVIYYAL